jgi:hypothetical protein
MTSPHLLWLLSGVAAILILATVIGQALRPGWRRTGRTR